MPTLSARHAGTVVLSCLVAACGGDGDDVSRSADGQVPGEIVVFAAASLADAFGEIGDAFVADHPEATVTFNFAGSSELAAQIVEGAPADVFASADASNMRRLIDADITVGEPTVFATNVSEIVVAPGNPLGIDGVADLADDELVLVTCAPAVPCGAYAAQIFRNAGISPTPDSYEENVKAVMTKVTLGEADVGVVYATDVVAAGDVVAGVEIPTDLNVVADYPIAGTSVGRNPVAAAGFVDFVLGATGQSVLIDHGFSSP